MYTAKADASLREKSGIGYVIYKDDIPISRCRKQHSSKNINQLEYIAVLELLKDINDIGVKNIKIYTDNKNLTDFLKVSYKGKEKEKKENQVIREIQYWMKMNPSVGIEWISRKENNDAHKLCRQSAIGEDDFKDLNELIEIKNSKIKHITKMVVKNRSRIIMKCPSCKEMKQASEFPRYKTNTKKRFCCICKNRLNMIEHGHLIMKHTY